MNTLSEAVNNFIVVTAVKDMVSTLVKVDSVIHEMTWEDTETCLITLASGSAIQVTIDNHITRTIVGKMVELKPKFTVGHIEFIHGHWEPGCDEFVIDDEFDSPVDAVLYALLLPKKWEIEALIEKLGIKRTVEAIG